jgi:glycosyltransferase involved in cell wall biosynthesis
VPLRVVILSAFLTPFRSGAEACAEEVSARLKDDFDITIVTARLRKDLPYLDHLPSGVKVWRVGFGTSFDKWLYPFLAPRAARALKPDIVHAVLETFAGLALMRLKGIKARRILTMQTTNRTFLKGPIVRSADTVTAISSALVKIAGELGRKDVTLISNGIDLNMLKQARDKHAKIDGRILYVGRLEPMKGIDTLLDAFAPIADAHPEAHLVIVGGGSLRVSLESRKIDLVRAGRISFRGYLSPEKVANEFASASIFCGLSRSEALGNVFLEAQAAGCAVIGTTVGGIPDIVHHAKTGLLVSPDDVKGAAEALKQLLSDESLRAKLSEAGEKNAEAYDWNAVSEQYRAVYLTK